MPTHDSLATNAPSSSRMTFIVLRYMRKPLLVLITVYAVSMVGWVLIPGVNANGVEQELSFFHAFYFLTYTVTTTGFGELPHTFTEAQRMWSIVSLYAGVIAWFYALGSIVGLVQNVDFQQSVAERRFAKRVGRISEPFCIICGFGNTGAMLTRGLTDTGTTVVVVDRNAERIRTLGLRDYRNEVSGLCADAGVPEHLIEAGLGKPNCRAVIALTQNEAVNLKISVTARLLNPTAWVITQSTSESHEDTLATLGENVHIIDPFQTYAKYLGATITNPEIHTLNQWLVGAPGATLEHRLQPPKGTWILCGYGRMGRRIREALEAQGVSTIVIDPHAEGEDDPPPGRIVGLANQKNLVAAGIAEAAGIVAGSDNDSDNLSILLNARAMNPEIFCVVRQNLYRDQIVFQAAKANLIMMPSLVAARRILFLLTAPMLKTLFETLRAGDAADDGVPVGAVIARLEAAVGGMQPRLWTVDTEKMADSALLRFIAAGRSVRLADLIADPGDRGRRLAVLPIVHRSGGQTQVLPDLSTAILPGDQILFCGSSGAYRLLDATMHCEYTLDYLISGLDAPRGWLMRWLTGKLAPPAGAA